MRLQPYARIPLFVVLFTMLPNVALLAAPATGPSGYHLVRKVTLGGEGGWDCLTIDPMTRRLFVTHSTHVMVVNADTGKIVGDITDTPGVHDVAIAEDAGRGFISNGGNNTVTIFDLKTLQIIGHAQTGTHPDAALYDVVSHRVFAFNGGSSDATAINAATGEVAGTIALGGKPEFATADGAGTIYVNLEDRSELAVIDSRTLRVTQRWPLAPCEEPSGLALDAVHSRLFVGCHNQIMAIVDAHNGKVVTTVPIGSGVDGTRFEAVSGLVFSSNGDGTLTVVHEDTPDKYIVVENVTTERGARTMEIDPKTQNVYLITADLKPTQPTTENPHPRPSIVPGTFRLLIFSRR
jgi:DNA-binding beta-propeller fold protein YncE